MVSAATLVAVTVTAVVMSFVFHLPTMAAIGLTVVSFLFTALYLLAEKLTP